MHTSMCEACKKYSHQSKELDVLIKNHVENFIPQDSTPETKTTPDFKDKIISSLED